MKRMLYKGFSATSLVIALTGCAVFEPAYPDPVTKTAADGLEVVSELVAAAQLGDFSKPASYHNAAPRYAAAVARLEVVRGWALNRSEADDGLPATEAVKLMADDLGTCVTGVQDMAERHRSVGLAQSPAYTTIRLTCAIPINNILQ
ncbi:MAG: hypothetical protein WBB85_14855 [Albidovulum sp.]|uniref:hypothetical protein n=1 Tax=Albidovulum sp. TaxID=1872424 RepID=UPI003C849DB0